MSTWSSIVVIAAGAAIGANLRWLLGTEFNAYLPQLPLGTLAANLLGAFLIGLAIAFFAALPSLSPLWRLFFITGFLGALTTFSTFSAEIVTNLQSGRIAWAFAGIFVHVLGSLLMVGVGIAVFALIRTLVETLR